MILLLLNEGNIWTGEEMAPSLGGGSFSKDLPILSSHKTSKSYNCLLINITIFILKISEKKTPNPFQSSFRPSEFRNHDSAILLQHFIKAYLISFCAHK